MATITAHKEQECKLQSPVDNFIRLVQLKKTAGQGAQAPTPPAVHVVVADDARDTKSSDS